MSRLNINNLTNENEDGSPKISGISTFSSTHYFVPPSGSTAERPSHADPGMIRFNTDSGHLEYYNGVEWTSVIVNNNELDGGNRGLFAGGFPTTNTIDYITISTLGNATTFGTLSQTRYSMSDSACSSSTRGVFGGGYASPVSSVVNTIDFVTISSTGNAQDFGDLTQARDYIGACSSSTRGIFGGGTAPTATNTIDYITIATTGNATDFGDMSINRRGYGSCASLTRGLFGGGYASNYTANIEYITIATPSNGTSFGSLSDTQTLGIMGAGSETRGLFAGGESGYTNRIDYVTIASTGNATDFGDLTAARKNGSTTSDGTKAVFFGGENSQTTLDYVTIATTGNAASWGGSFSTGTNTGGIGNVNNGTRGVIAVGGTSGASYSDIIEYLTMTTGSNSTDFGNLSQGRSTPSQASTDTRGVFGGGKYQSGGSSGTVTIDYITIATTGNATDFGDLTTARYAGGAVSDQGGDRT